MPITFLLLMIFYCRLISILWVILSKAWNFLCINFRLSIPFGAFKSNWIFFKILCRWLRIITITISATFKCATFTYFTCGLYIADAMGLTSQVTVEAGSNGKLEFCLVWDMPVVNFRNNARKYNRYSASAKDIIHIIVIHEESTFI